MVLPTRTLLTFSLAVWRLSFSARAPLSLAQYGVTAPFNPTHAFTRRGIEEMIRFSAAPRLALIHAMAFRTRARKAFSLSHPVGFVLAKRNAPQKEENAFTGTS